MADLAQHPAPAPAVAVAAAKQPLDAATRSGPPPSTVVQAPPTAPADALGAILARSVADRASSTGPQLQRTATVTGLTEVKNAPGTYFVRDGSTLRIRGTRAEVNRWLREHDSNTVQAGSGSALGLRFIAHGPNVGEQVALGAGAMAVGGVALTAGVVAAPLTGGASAVAAGVGAVNSYKWLKLGFGTREEDELVIYAPWRGEPIGSDGMHRELGRSVTFGRLANVVKTLRP